MIKILNRYNGAVLFEAEPAASTPSGLALRNVLEQAVMARAYLSGADLSDADLSGADLSDANLSGADLSGADLSDADLTAFRDDLWAVLSSAPREAAAVLAALHAGKVDGSTYSGSCACLVGTIANARHCDIGELGALKADSSRLAETWFMQIKPGNTPENHEPTKLAAEWVSQWLDAMRSAFGAPIA